MEPYRLNYNSNVNPSINNRTPSHTQKSADRQNNSTMNQNIVWEPYGIRTPRKIITEDERMKALQRKIDEDWIHAYATYSPYKTSNQEYGCQVSQVNIPPNAPSKHPNSYNQVPNNPRQQSIDVNTNVQGSPQPPMLNLLAKHGLPPLAYRTPRPPQNT